MVTREQIWNELQSVSEGIEDPRFATFVLEQVAYNLGVSIVDVSRVIVDMNDHIGKALMKTVVFPLERAFMADVPESEPRKKYIYILHWPEQDVYKIGVSCSPGTRVSSINRAAPPGIQPVSVLESFETVVADEVEKIIHERWAGMSINSDTGGTEWFRFEPDEVDLVIDDIKRVISQVESNIRSG